MMTKRYAAEFVGTFGIVFPPVALAASGHLAGGESSLLVAALVSGLPVLAMIYALGPISAAHFNPAVTLGFAVARRFPWKYVAPYWGAQFLGGIAAAGLARALFGASAGAHIPADPSSLVRNLGVEAIITMILMIVIVSVATDKRAAGTVPGLAIGLTVVFNVLAAGGVTGASMNPARSFGPAAFAGGEALENYWLYLVGPMLGAVVGAAVFEFLRIEHQYSQGAPNELLEALQEVATESHHR